MQEILAPFLGANLKAHTSGGLRFTPTIGYFLPTLRVAGTLSLYPFPVSPIPLLPIPPFLNAQQRCERLQILFRLEAVTRRPRVWFLHDRIQQNGLQLTH